MTLPKKMCGVILTGHGEAEMLVVRDDLPVPTPGPNDVIIRVAAAGVNNTDINTRTAWYSKGEGEDTDASWSGNPIVFPRIQGADVCGRIAAVGVNVSESRIGERVLIEPCLRLANGVEQSPPWYFGSECNGGFAQYTRVDTSHAYAVQSDLTDIELASFPCSYSTAENMLTRANVGPGETVLVTGASGGVGSATVQLARARGARVIAITSPAKMDMMRDLGVERALPRDANLVAELGVESIDVVVDLVAGPNWPALLDVLRRGGRYAVAGAIGGAMVELDIRTLYLRDLSFFGCTVLEPEVFGTLVGRIERSEIKPLVAEVFELKDINSAQTAFGIKAYTGKIVLEVNSA